MTFGGLGAGLAVALLSGFVTRRTQLREDASLAAFSLIALALGVLIVSMRGNNMDLMRVLFGMVLALDDTTYCCAQLLVSLCSFSLCCCDHWFWNALTPSSFARLASSVHLPTSPSLYSLLSIL